GFVMTLAALRAVEPNDAPSHEDIRQDHDELKLLLAFTNSLVSTLELREVLMAVMKGGRRIMRSDSVVVALPHADSGHLRACPVDNPEGGGLLRENELIEGEIAVATAVFRTGTPWAGRFGDVRECGPERHPSCCERRFTVGC